MAGPVGGHSWMHAQYPSGAGMLGSLASLSQEESRSVAASCRNAGRFGHADAAALRPFSLYHNNDSQVLIVRLFVPQVCPSVYPNGQITR